MYYMSVHETVISIEHLAIAGAGYFVLLASFAVQRKEYFYTVKLRTYNCIVFIDFQHAKLYPFQNLSLAFILKIFLKFRKFQPRYSYKIYSYKKSVF